MIYYAMSDIHGYLSILKETMKVVNLEEPENKLLFLGDYIDYGEESCKTLYYLQELEKSYPNQVIVLRGNHEEMFLQWILYPQLQVNWLTEDREFLTTKTFLTEEQTSCLKKMKNPLEMSQYAAEKIKENHKELLRWLKNLLYYYETDRQIFVHAGIEEEAEEWWKLGTPKEYFTSKYPATKGHFYKDIIAGHIGTAELRKDKNCHEIYWDKKSHYYIDGTTRISKKIPVLQYNTETKKYYNADNTVIIK